MMVVSKKQLCLMMLVLGIFTSFVARADLNISITQGAVGATPIGIVPFGWHGPANSKAPVRIGSIISHDLERTGLFAPLPLSKLPQRPTSPGGVEFDKWTSQGVSDLVIGSLTQTQPGQFSLSFQLFDTLQGQQIKGYRFTVGKSQLIQAAHYISNIIYQQLTGQRGIFTTRIAFVRSIIKNGRVSQYQLVVSDYDGQEAHTVYQSAQPIAMPAWSPDGHYLAYVSYTSNGPVLYLQNLKTGHRTVISDHPGLNSAPAFSPDGRELSMTLSKDGYAQIFILNLKTKKLSQFTSSPSINTGAKWLPNGQALLFTSDRGGSPQIYIKYLTGSSSQRLTYNGNYNAGVAISPDGNKIAFVHEGSQGFCISVMNLQTDDEENLTNGPFDGSPSFAPNGTMVLYSTHYQGKEILATVSMNGNVKARMAGAQNISQPVWGPFTQQSIQ